MTPGNLRIKSYFNTLPSNLEESLTISTGDFFIVPHGVKDVRQTSVHVNRVTSVLWHQLNGRT